MSTAVTVMGCTCRAARIRGCRAPPPVSSLPAARRSIASLAAVVQHNGVCLAARSTLFGVLASMLRQASARTAVSSFVVLEQ